MLTDEEGRASLSLSEGAYTYFASKDDYGRIDGSLELDKDTLIMLEMIRVEADLRFVIRDEQGPVEGAEVGVNGETRTSTSTGIVDFPDITLGTPLSYMVSGGGYKPVSDSLMPLGDTVVEVFLEPSVARVKFRIREAGMALPGALVCAEDSCMESNLVGIAVFNNLPVDSAISWTVGKDGYLMNSGTFLLSGDTTINLELLPLGGDPGQGSRLLIYPNPADDAIRIMGLKEGESWFLMDMTGKILGHGKAGSDNPIISLENVPPGSYVLRLSPCRRLLFIKGDIPVGLVH